MKMFLNCRRTYIATLAILALTLLGLFGGASVASSIASISIALGAANAWQGKKEQP